MEKTRQFQNILYHTAKKDKGRRFHALYDRIYQPEVLTRAWKMVKANKGAPGIDGVRIIDVEISGVEGFLSALALELKEGRYHAKTVRRVYIAKQDGCKRPLGIPTVRDRVVQQACKIILEPIFESNFVDSSYGYRPKRSAPQAVLKVKENLVRGWHVVDGDIKGFFDNMDHDLLLRILRKRIADGRVLRLIRGWLEAPVSGGLTYTSRNEKGSPQGGVISPLLSNIYLHVMDKFWEENCAHLGSLVRYADDFVIVCKTKLQANKALNAIRHILGRLKLELHPEKTKVVAMDSENFTFLGFVFRKWKSRVLRKLVPYNYPAKDKINRIKSKIKSLVGSNMCLLPLNVIVDRVNPVIRGFRQYFRYGSSNKYFKRLDAFVFRRFRFHFFRRFSVRVKNRGEKFKRWWILS